MLSLQVRNDNSYGDANGALPGVIQEHYEKAHVAKVLCSKFAMKDFPAPLTVS